MRYCTYRSLRSTLSLACAAVAVSVFTARPCSADVVNASSNGYGVSADVHLVSTLVGINVPAVPVAAGAAPAPYDTNGTLLTLNVSAAGVASLSTGLLTSHALSDVTGVGGGMARGEAVVNGLNLRVLPGIVSVLDTLNAGATTITSSAQLTSDGVTITPLGASHLENASIYVFGVGNLAINANAAPNTVLLDLLGIRIILNEQILTTFGNTTTFQVNAIHITIDSPLQLVSADVVVAHSEASMTVPTPGVAASLAGLGALGAMRRRRR
ncbi:MAG: choice-of-anchor P family protein [Phycisphaerales bacterium]